MIWDEEIEVVVMLASVIEGGRNKCEQYWPSTVRSVIVYENIEVTALHVDLDDVYDPSMKTTTLQVSNKLIVGSKRIIKHLQYTAWPDHGLQFVLYSGTLDTLLNNICNFLLSFSGVPSIQGFVQLIEKYSELQVQKQTPTSLTLVHCSAGTEMT